MLSNHTINAIYAYALWKQPKLMKRQQTKQLLPKQKNEMVFEMQKLRAALESSSGAQSWCGSLDCRNPENFPILNQIKIEQNI